MSLSPAARWRADREYRQAFRLLRAGKPAEAAKSFERVLVARPTHFRAEAQRARALAAAGRTSEAIRAARQAAELAPKSSVPLLFLGQIQYDAGAYEEARKAFRQAAERDPENQLIQAYLGLTALRGGQFEEAAPLLERYLLFGYEGLEARMLVLAERYLWEHRDKARTLRAATHRGRGRRATPPPPASPCAPSRWCGPWCCGRWRGCGEVRGWRGCGPKRRCRCTSSSGPMPHYRAAEAAGADAMEMALAQGVAYYEAGKSQAAAEQLLRLPEEMQQDPEVAGLLGGALFESGRCEQARPFLAIAATRLRKDFAPAYYRGLCAIALGKDKEAVSWFEQAAERLNPELAKKRLEEMLRVRQELSEGR